MQGLYRDQGIVLRSVRLGEADRIVTIYTQSHGRVRAVAKGIRKSRSRFGGRLDAFTHVDLQLYSGRSDLDTVTQAEIITRHPELRQNYAAFCAAGAMADAVERTTPERDRNVRLFVLFRSGLQALADGAADPALIAYAFLAKAASLAGLHPGLQACVGCGALERAAFSFAGGGVVCPACMDRTDPAVAAEVLDAWTGLLSAEWGQLEASGPQGAFVGELGRLVVAFVQWHSDTRLRAFGLLRPGEPLLAP